MLYKNCISPRKLSVFGKSTAYRGENAMKQFVLSIVLCFLWALKLPAFDLFQNIREGNREAVQHYLQSGGDPNARHVSTRDTALMVASRFSHVQIVRDLLAARANVHATNEKGETALMAAIPITYQGYLADPLGTKRLSIISTVRELIQAGADVNAASRQQISVLGYLVFSSESTSTGFSTYPERVHQTYRTHITEMLMEAGADIHGPANADQSVLQRATDLNDLEILTVFNPSLSAGDSVLMQAVHNRDVEAVKRLLITEDVNETDPFGRTAIMFLSDEEDEASILITEMLMKAGANVNKTDQFGRTAIDLFVYNHHIQGLNRVFTYTQFPIDQTTGWNMALFILATDQREDRAVEMVLSEFGSYTIDEIGQIALMDITRNIPEERNAQNISLMMGLTELANHSLIDTQNLISEASNTAREFMLAYAIEKGYTALAESFIQSGTTLENNNDAIRLLWTASQKGDTKAIRLLIAAGVDINAKDESTHKTALIHAVEHKQVPAVELLINMGADVDVKFAREAENAGLDSHLISALHLIADPYINVTSLTTENLEIANRLIAAEIDLEYKVPWHNQTTLERLIRWMDRRSSLDPRRIEIQIIASLIRAGAIFDIESIINNDLRIFARQELLKKLENDSLNDLHATQLLWLASQTGDVDTIRMLLAAGVNVDVRDESTRKTALIHAVQHLQVEAVRVLIDAEADVNVKFFRDRASTLTSALHLVADPYIVITFQPEVLKIVDMLIAARIDLEYRPPEHNQTILERLIRWMDHRSNLALRRIEIQIMAKLIHAGAVFDIESISNNDLKTFLQEELRNKTRNELQQSGLPKIIIAARLGDTEEVRRLDAAGVDVNAVDPQTGKTALMEAAEAGHAQTVEVLLLARPNIHHLSGEQINAVRYAVRNSEASVIRVLNDLLRYRQKCVDPVLPPPIMQTTN